VVGSDVGVGVGEADPEGDGGSECESAGGVRNGAKERQPLPLDRHHPRPRW
jgi:hypothetical protein